MSDIIKFSVMVLLIVFAIDVVISVGEKKRIKGDKHD